MKKITKEDTLEVTKIDDVTGSTLNDVSLSYNRNKYYICINFRILKFMEDLQLS